MKKEGEKKQKRRERQENEKDEGSGILTPKPPQNILQRRTNPKVLLFQPQLFSLPSRVIRVEDFRDVLSLLRRLNGRFVVTGVEGLKIESRDRFGRPETDVVDVSSFPAWG